MAKKEKVQEMFNGIAPKYDLLNHLLSMGIDKSWRKTVSYTHLDVYKRQFIGCAERRIRELIISS